MLELENVHVNYGHIKALKGISLSVDQGEIVALIGSNGAGKTTTLVTISGILKPKEGEVRFLGDVVSNLSADRVVKAGIVQVPEGRRVFPRMTVLENLKMGAYTRPDRNSISDDIESVFEFFPILKARSSQNGGTLSGGEQQMLAIGRAIMSKPKLLLLDEPSLGLAPVIIEQVFRKIREIGESGISILLVEQNARAALSLAHRAYVMETGNIAMEGPSSSLANDPAVQQTYLGG